MKDPLINSLAERFASHEVPVDPGMWSAISGQLAVASGSSLSGLLQEKFAGHEAPVDPQVWTSISSQLGHGAATGVGSTAGWWAAGLAATIVAGGVLLYNLTGEPTPAGLAEKAQVVAPVTSEVLPVTPAPTTVNATAPAPQVTTNGDVPRNDNPSSKATAAVTGSNTGHSEDNAQGSAANGKQIDPPPTPEGEKTVNTVLQDIVDNYVTSTMVAVTEPKVPPPTQKEMPSEEVHPQHDATASEDNEEAEPEAPAIIPAASAEVMIPTAFSPNSDGVNDRLEVLGQHYQKAHVRIFSATSNALVFRADNLDTPWDGTLMNGGQKCEPGMYFYALEVTGDDGRTLSKGEVVRLFR